MHEVLLLLRIVTDSARTVCVNCVMFNTFRAEQRSACGAAE
jgi:hypothetical protein